MIQLRSSLWNGPRTSSEHSTGTMVTAINVAPTNAKVFVHASGWKSLPSWPPITNTGTKARMTMAMAKKIGRPTCWAAARVMSQVSRAVRRAGEPSPFFALSSSARSQCRMTFSVITIPASTSTPMAMAMPESDMMFDEMPKWFMRMNETRIETGNGIVTIRMLRKWKRKIMCASVTRRISSTSATRSVSIVRPMRSERS